MQADFLLMYTSQPGNMFSWNSGSLFASFKVACMHYNTKFPVLVTLFYNDVTDPTFSDFIKFEGLFIRSCSRLFQQFTARVNYIFYSYLGCELRRQLYIFEGSMSSTCSCVAFIFIPFHLFEIKRS